MFIATPPTRPSRPARITQPVSTASQPSSASRSPTGRNSPPHFHRRHRHPLAPLEARSSAAPCALMQSGPTLPLREGLRLLFSQLDSQALRGAWERLCTALNMASNSDPA